MKEDVVMGDSTFLEGLRVGIGAKEGSKGRRGSEAARSFNGGGDGSFCMG